MRTRKILVPLDGGPIGEAALPYAEAIARRTGAALALVRAVHAQSMETIRVAEEYVADLADQLANRKLAVETGVPYGSAAEWIVEEVALRKADLVIMATHDRTGPDRWLHGSVAEAVVNHAPVPVVIVRAAQGMRPADRLDSREPALVVPLDGSDISEAVLPTACQFAAEIRAKLVLVVVVPQAGQLAYLEAEAGPMTIAESARLEAEAHTYLDTLTQDIGAQLVLDTSVRLGDPATEIVAEAEARNAAAVVMATHGRTGVLRTLLGSVAGKVVHAGTLPVMLVRPATLRGAEKPVGVPIGAATTS